jgi:glycine/D-amino acid oxidase-like deaminating enzyme
MVQLPDNETSYWEASAASTSFPSLNSDIAVDVAIIGGGIAGLNAAYMLKRSGKTVAVIEKDLIGSGVSNNTTGKVTSQHSKIYHELFKRFGETKARKYAEANQAALKNISHVIKTESIQCDWDNDDNYVYTSKPGQIDKFKQEAEIAQKLGLPATFETSIPLPFEVKAAVKFSNQARFNIKKYLIGLANAVDGNGSYTFENTRASPAGVNDGVPCTVKTSGGRVAAENVVIATNVPFTMGARGSYCIMEYPQKSYIVAGKPKNSLKGMYISPDSEHYSIMPTNTGNGQLLLVGGESHITGMRLSTKKHYQRLAEYAVKHFQLESIQYRWAARDYQSYDDIPLVGKLYPWSRNVYVTTAYRKWGLTNTMVSAIILRDLINNQANAWAELYNSNRFKPIASIPKVFASYVGLR